MLGPTVGNGCRNGWQNHSIWEQSIGAQTFTGMIRLDDPVNGLIFGMCDAITTGDSVAVGASFRHPVMPRLIISVLMPPAVGVAGATAFARASVRMPVLLAVQIKICR